MIPTNPDPAPLLDVELGVPTMDEVQLTPRMLAPQLTVTVEGGSTTGTDFDHCKAIELAVALLRMRSDRLDHEPLIRVR